MKKIFLLFMILILTQVSFVFSMSLEESIKNPLRTEEYKLRDQYRHPKETLEFFGY